MYRSIRLAGRCKELLTVHMRSFYFCKKLTLVLYIRKDTDSEEEILEAFKLLDRMATASSLLQSRGT